MDIESRVPTTEINKRIQRIGERANKSIKEKFEVARNSKIPTHMISQFECVNEFSNRIRTLMNNLQDRNHKKLFIDENDTEYEVRYYKDYSINSMTRGGKSNHNGVTNHYLNIEVQIRLRPYGVKPDRLEDCILITETVSILVRQDKRRY